MKLVFVYSVFDQLLGVASIFSLLKTGKQDTFGFKKL